MEQANCEFPANPGRDSVYQLVLQYGPDRRKKTVPEWPGTAYEFRNVPSARLASKKLEVN